MPETIDTDTLQQQIETVFQQQKTHAAHVRHSKAGERIKKLKNLKKVIFEHRGEVRKALEADFRKPEAETDLTEILSLGVDIKHTIKNLKGWMKNRKAGTPLPLLGSKSYIHYEPKGVALIISPWNYPFYLCMSPLVYAIAAGNCAILKPSEFTPHTTAVIRKIIARIFPEKEVALFEGDKEVASELLQKKFDHIYFTGSPAVGKIIMKAASQQLASVTLELGGKSPVVVDSTANLKDAAEKIAWGKFMNAGQTCIAPDYMLVHNSVKAEMVERMAETVKRYYNAEGKGTERSDSLARIINRRNYDRLASMLADAMDKGATIEFGGKTIADENFIEPTLVSNLPKDARLMEEEIFGPVLPVIGFDSLEEAIHIIHQMDKPLAFYIFSKSRENTNKLLAETTSGGCCINETIVHVSNPELPFGGVNHSGIGKGHGHWGFIEFSNERAVLKQRTGFTGLKLMYPPYTSKVKKLINQTMKLYS